MFTIARETRKALLLRENGKEFWIQKNWLRADGSLTPAGEKTRDEAINAKDEDFFFNNRPFKTWSPEKHFGRIYFGEGDYIQVRYNPLTTRATEKAVGSIATQMLEEFPNDVLQIAIRF